MGLMKRIFLLLSFLVCFFVSKAQILQKQNTYGIGFNRTGADTLIYIPSDTLSVPSWGVGKTHIARKGTTLYYWDGSKWSAISGSGGTYAAGNGLTLSGSQFKLGGTLSENTHLFGANKRLTADSLNYFDFVSRPNTYASLARIRANGSFDEGTSGVLLSSSNEDNTDSSYLKVSGTVELRSWGQDIRLKNIPTVSSTTRRKVALIDTATGKVERIDPATLVTTPTLQQVLTAGSTLTKNDTIYLNSYYLRILNNGAEYLVIDPTLNNEYAELRSYNPTEVNDARLKVNTTNLLSNGQFEADFGDGVNVSRVDLQSSSGVSKVILSAYNDGGGLNESYLHVELDSIHLEPEKGVLNIDSLRTWSGISDTTYKKPMTWDTRNGRWEYAANWYAPVTESNTVTLTNKRWTARVGSTTSSATPTINTDNVDIYKLTAQTADITSFTTNLSGTPNDGDILEIQITGTAARAITWGSSFVSTTVTLPTTTTSTNTLTVILQYYTTSSYGNNKWHCVNYY